MGRIAQYKRLEVTSERVNKQPASASVKDYEMSQEKKKKTYPLFQFPSIAPVPVLEKRENSLKETEKHSRGAVHCRRQHQPAEPSQPTATPSAAAGPCTPPASQPTTALSVL
ncbi:hypothetical protein PIB30_051502 [Stylosanthes scabra]|uniref:Uncharacterized protein n=1 Tax=Stylosanthes scabra TaxID=79078 RepID=A0ABU6RIV8_9FABA|nr:hypothetical protein [Stylosanthes scabra]